MRRQTPSSLDVLADALGVFLFAVRKSWGKLLAVLLPLEIIFVLSSRLLCDGDALSFESVRFVRLAGRLYSLLWMTFGLVAVATIAETSYRICRGIEVWCDPAHGPGGLGGSWRRLLVTTWLVALLVVVWATVLVVAVTAGLMTVRSPLANSGGAASGLAAVLAAGVVAASVATGLWFVCPWIFATTMCVVRPVSGFSALKMSAAFEKGRMGRCVWFLVLSVLTMLGLQSSFGLVRHHFIVGMASASWLECVHFVLVSVVQDVAYLYGIVALMVFWRRTEDAEQGVLALPPPRRNKVLVALLMVVGIGFLAWSLMIGYDHLQKARAEREKQQEVWDGMEASLEQKPKARFFCRSRSSSPRANRVGAIVCYNTHDDSLSREQL